MTTNEPTAPVPDFDAVLKRFEGLPRLPVSTYRIQLHRDFGFRRAAELVPYLAGLGVGAVYCSPYLQARPGSPH